MEWNLGSKHWVRKLEMIQATVDQHNPDVIFLTEANLFKSDPDYCQEIEGYNVVRPLTWDNPDLEYARIIMLVKPEVKFEVMTQHMEHDISSIWIKMARQGHKRLIIGGIYREHRHLKQADDLTASKASQEERWRRTIEQWTSISAGNECVVLGDINLDHSKWMDPPQKHANMVETTQKRD